MAVLAAFVFSGTIGFFVYQKIAYPILADIADSNIVAPVSEEEKLASSESNSSISATCGKDETLVAISNYPGLGIINKIDEPKTDYMHGYWYEKMDLNYWSCSHICVQKSANVSELLKDSGLKIAEETREISVMIDKPEDMLLAYKNNPQQIKYSIVETKPMCLGPNSKDYAPIGSEFIKGDKVIAKIVERKSTYDLQKASTTTKSSDAKPGIQSANISAPPTGDGDGAVPGTDNSTNNNNNTNGPLSDPLADNSQNQTNNDPNTLEGCWKGVSQTSANHLTKHLFTSGKVYVPTSRDKVINDIRYDLVNLHAKTGKELSDEIYIAYNKYKKGSTSAAEESKMLTQCQAIKTRLSAGLSTERADITALNKCTDSIIKTYDEINKLELGLLSATQKSRMEQWRGYKSKKTFSLENPNFHGTGGIFKINDNNTKCKAIMATLNDIKNNKVKTSGDRNGQESGLSSTAKVTIIGNIAITQKDVNSGVNNGSSSPIHVCVYLKTIAGGKTECKKVMTKRKDGGFWVSFNVSNSVLSELKKSSENKIYVYSVWNTAINNVRNIYTAIPSHKGSSVDGIYNSEISMINKTNSYSTKSTYEIQIHKPLVLYGQRIKRLADSFLVPVPRYDRPNENTLEIKKDQFITDTGGKNCLFIDPLEKIGY